MYSLSTKYDSRHHSNLALFGCWRWWRTEDSSTRKCTCAYLLCMKGVPHRTRASSGLTYLFRPLDKCRLHLKDRSTGYALYWNEYMKVGQVGRD